MRRVLILFSDTGGGHRAAAEAISRALSSRYGPEVRVTLVDLFTRYAPYPFSRLPVWYPAMVGPGVALWRLGHRLTNGPRRVRLLDVAMRPFLAPAARQLQRDSPADVVVCAHALLIRPALAAFYPRTRVVAVVTDLAAPHAWWFHPDADITVVPNDDSRSTARAFGVADDRLRIAGIPIDPGFGEPADVRALRAGLGWSADRPVVTVVGGGDGTGPVFEVVRALAGAGLTCELAVIAGRNRALATRLRAAAWPVRVHIYDFVRNMPDVVRASDVLVTKAGPGTIAEALAAGLPLVLYHFIPGQETGNVDFVVRHGAGVWAPTPSAAAASVRAWLESGSAARLRAAASARAAARPAAADEIARIVWDAGARRDEG